MPRIRSLCVALLLGLLSVPVASAQTSPDEAWPPALASTRAADAPLGLACRDCSASRHHASASCNGSKKKKKLVYVGVLGTVFEKETPKTDWCHLYGSFQLSTADYFRGRYDGVPEDEEIAFFPTLGVVLELWEGQGALSDLNLTVGNQNGWAEDPGPVQRTDFWYESNFYLGLSGKWRKDWLFGVTYTRYDSVDGIFGTTDEVATAVSYSPSQGFWSRLKPQFKAAFPTDPTGGVFLQSRITPSMKIERPCQAPITLRTPLIVGVGLDDYYGPDTSGATYGRVGLEASIPLSSLPKRYGNWTFDAGVATIIRDQDIVRQGYPVDDAENTVVVGSTGLSFVY